MKTILHFIKKEFLQFKRDPKMFGIILVAPVIQLLFLGYAAKFDVDVVPTALIDYDRSITSREYINKFKSSGYFSFNYYINSYEELENLIDNGKVILGIVIPNDFAKNLGRLETVHVQAIFDGSDGNTAAVSSGYVQSITYNFAKQILLDYRNKTGKKLAVTGSITSEVRVWN